MVMDQTVTNYFNFFVKQCKKIITAIGEDSLLSKFIGCTTYLGSLTVVIDTDIKMLCFLICNSSCFM